MEYQLSLDERRVVFQILIKIIRADKIIRPEKESLLNKVIDDFKLSMKD
jgi:hypothetical protein